MAGPDGRNTIDLEPANPTNLLDDPDERAAYLAALVAADVPDASSRSWRPVDLAAVLDGGWQSPEPTVGRRDDGIGLFYPGKSHTVSSETEAGKTWFALAAVLDEINAGHHVVYLDFEDDEGSIGGRLVYLGAHRDTIRDRFHYVRPVDPIGVGANLDDLRHLLATYTPTLGVVDGITEAMVMHGLNPLKNDEIARFGRMLPRRIAAAGAAAVSLDHVTKDREGRGRYSLGGVHKLNGLDGAAYVLENRKPFGIGIVGKSTIRLAKDRPAQLRKHAIAGRDGMHWFGDLELDSKGDEFAEISIGCPTQTDDGDDWRPTVLMGRISDALAKHGPLSQRRIRAAVTGKNDAISKALDCLILDGHVTEKSPHELLKPYPPEVAE